MARWPDAGCCCPHPDAHRCAQIRYSWDTDEPCTCGCHDGGEDDGWEDA